MLKNPVTVSIAACEDYDAASVRAALFALLQPLGGMEAFVCPGERILIKPNMLSAKPPEAAVTTHPTLVEAVAEMVIAAGGRAMIGDSQGIGSFRKVAEVTGIAAVASRTGAELVEFDESIEIAGSGTFRLISLARAYWDADKIINLPKLKTHEMMTLTCAVKNLFGAVVGTRKAGWHLAAGESRELFARLLLEIYLLKPPVLNIVDGIVAMEGDGPGSGDPVRSGLLLASGSGVAVDLIAGKAAGISPELLPIQQEAAKLKLPGSTLEDIIIAGIRLPDSAPRPFRLPKGLSVRFGLPDCLSRMLKRHLTANPAPDRTLCVLCGICRDACPPQAITIAGGKLTIDLGSCIHCWCCRELCPHHAMNACRGRLLSLMSALRSI